MAILSVNVNKIATLRNARGGNVPDVLQTALDIEAFGAQGITVHPRPDERHIRRTDVLALKQALRVELNIEGYPSPEFLALLKEARPAQVTLVPDPPHVITSNAGWKVAPNLEFLRTVITTIKSITDGARVSLFIDPQDYRGDAHDFGVVAATGADRIELYTEAYASAWGTSEHAPTLARYVATAAKARSHGLKINAGHDLNLENLADLVRAIPDLAEVSIGHALICDALYLGFAETISRYRREAAP